MINTKRVTLTFSKQCNMKCPFCYGHFDGNDLLEIEKYKEIVRRCKNLGVETLNIAGGDPLIYKNVDEIVAFSKSLGMRTTMDTNCLLFNSDKHETLVKTLDMISVPIDGCNELIHDKVRAFKGSFQKIIKSLNAISSLSDKIEIRVNTIVVKDNYKQLEGIAELLNQYPITFWHIYDFIPIGKGRQSREDLYVNHTEYRKLIYDIMCKGYKYTIAYNEPDKRKSEHIYVSSDGTVYSNSSNASEDYIMGRSILGYSSDNILEYLGNGI